MRYILLLFTLIGTSGCTTFLDDASGANWIKYEDANEIIIKYEKTGVVQSKRKICEIYAIRSACFACQDPAFEATQTCFSLMSEFTYSENYYTGWIVPMLFMPFCSVVDILYLPFQSYNTLTFPEEHLKKALKDMKTARKLGYKSDTIYPGFNMFGIRSINLDRVYNIENPSGTSQ